MNFPNEVNIPFQEPLFRGEKRLRIALVGIPKTGKTTIFNAVSSASIHSGELVGSHRAYDESRVQIGLDEASLVDLPSIDTLIDLQQDDLVTLKYLLWGDQRPPVSAHEPGGPPAPFAQPDVIIQVMDAAALGRHLELFLELSTLGRPMVVALNGMDEAWEKGLHINVKTLSKRIGVPVIPTVAHMGQGLSELFTSAVDAVRQDYCPLPQPANQHICDSLQPLSKALVKPEIHKAFLVPHEFLLIQLAANDSFVVSELQQHFPEQYPYLMQLREAAELTLPRPLPEEIHADRHHRAASLREAVSRAGAPHEGRGWRYWLDELFLHPQWGLLGSMAVFAGVLFVVFEVSAWLDSQTAARLIELVSAWQPQSTGGVVSRAVVDGLIGLIGIVVPYMIPLVLLLVALEETGIMQRIAFVVDRGFHQIGLHGGVAVPFLLGLGCNVPAISSVARHTTGRDRFVASVLITFVPCSARSAVILALAGKYLGGMGVFFIFLLTTIIIAVLGRLLKRRYRDSGPGQVQEIPPYGLPQWRTLFYQTWLRTRDILTIVTPLLVGGSVILALLNHVGADDYINTLFIPITSWWLGLPVVLGVPILFGILRKELSLLMIYQALGTFDVGSQLDWIQIMTFLIFLTFYIPCVSTFAIMLKTIGRKPAVISILFSVGVALLISGVVRLLLEGVDLFLPV
jgi:ferrous iron transport protein B